MFQRKPSHIHALQICLAIVVTQISFPFYAQAQQPARQFQDLVLFEAQGDVKIRSADGNERTVKTSNTDPDIADRNVKPGESILVSAGAKVSGLLPGGGSLLINEDSQVQVPVRAKRSEDATHSLELLRGRLFIHIDPNQPIRNQEAAQFRLKTPTLLLAVKGTQFFADVEGGAELVGVHQGAISVATKRGDQPVEVPLRAGGVIEMDADGKASGRRMTAEEAGWAEIYGAFQIKPIALKRWTDKKGPNGENMSWNLSAVVAQKNVGNVADTTALGIEEPKPIQSPTKGEAYEVRFSRIADLNQVELSVNVEAPRHNPKAYEFFVRGVGLKQVRTTETVKIADVATGIKVLPVLSEGTWRPVILPFFPDDTSGFIRFQVDLTDEFLLPDSKEFVLQVAHGSYLYSQE